MASGTIGSIPIVSIEVLGLTDNQQIPPATIRDGGWTSSALYTGPLVGQPNTVSRACL